MIRFVASLIGQKQWMQCLSVVEEIESEYGLICNLFIKVRQEIE